MSKTTDPKMRTQVNQLKNLFEINNDKSTEKANGIFKSLFDWGNNPNNLVPTYWNFFDKYKEFISTLNSEQLGCLTNALFYMIIISCTHSIFTAYYGNWLINYFNLETKIPKFAKYLQLRSKISIWGIHMDFAII